MTNSVTPESLLTINLQDFWQRVNSEMISGTADAFRHWQLGDRIPDGFSSKVWQHQQMCRFIAHEVSETHNHVLDLHKRYGLFASQVLRGATEQERWQHQVTFLKYLGYSKAKIKGDRAALKRWFGNDAIKDRYLNQAAEQERKLCFLLQRLGQLIQYFGNEYSGNDTETLLKALDLQTQLSPLLRYEGDDRVPLETMSCLRVAFDQLGSEIITTVDPAIAQHAYRIASDPYQPVWLQAEAVAVLFTLGQDSVCPLLLHRLGRPAAPPDDLFFRARALQTLYLSGTPQHRRP